MPVTSADPLPKLTERTQCKFFIKAQPGIWSQIEIAESLILAGTLRFLVISVTSGSVYGVRERRLGAGFRILCGKSVHNLLECASLMTTRSPHVSFSLVRKSP